MNYGTFLLYCKVCGKRKHAETADCVINQSHKFTHSSHPIAGTVQCSMIQLWSIVYFQFDWREIFKEREITVAVCRRLLTALKSSELDVAIFSLIHIMHIIQNRCASVLISTAVYTCCIGYTHKPKTQSKVLFRLYSPLTYVHSCI